MAVEYEFGPYRVSPGSRRIVRAGAPVAVGSRAFDIMLALIERRERVVRKDELIELVWPNIYVEENTLAAHVSALRKSLGDTTIVTYPGRGYKFAGEIREVATGPEPTLFDAGDVAATADAASASAPTPSPAGARGWAIVPAARRRFPRVVALALGAGLIVAVAIAIVIRLPVHSSPRWTVVRSDIPISERPIQRHPAISPDGAMIAYSGGHDLDSRQIYLKHVSGGEAVRLTNDPYDDASPSWSPDESEIAYVAFKEGEPCRLIATPVPAGSPRELGRCRNEERSHLVWAHSGEELFFIDRDTASSPERVMRFDLATGRRTPLDRTADGSSDEGEPAASPDGRWVAFPRCSSEVACQLIVFELQTGKERVVGVHSDVHGAAWSADSATLFFVTEQDGDFILWSWPAAGGEPARILTSARLIGRLSAGPRGLLAVEINHLEAELAEASVRPGDDRQLLDPSRGVDWGPDIAPGGTIAFIAERSGGIGLWLKPKGETPRRLIALHGEGTEHIEPRWSPDGSEIALVAPVGAALGLRVVSAEGTEVMAVPFPGLTLSTPAWTADGKALIFPGRDEHGWQLWRLDLATPSLPKPLGKRGWRYIRAQGDALYGVRADAPGIWRIDDPPRQIVAALTSATANAWTIAGGDIVFADSGACHHEQILAQPITGGAARVLAETPDDCTDSSFAVDPETGKIVYAAVREFGADIELLHLARE